MQRERRDGRDSRGYSKERNHHRSSAGRGKEKEKERGVVGGKTKAASRGSQPSSADRSLELLGSPVAGVAGGAVQLPNIRKGSNSSGHSKKR